MSRRLAALLLVALVLLSGCSFLGGTQSATPTPDGADGGTPAPDGNQSANGTVPASAYPAGYGPTGAAAVERALESHRSELLAHDSFTIAYQARLLTEDGQAAISSIQSANRTSERGYVATNISDRGSTVNYVTNGTRYVRTNPPGSGTEDVTYERGEATFDAARYAGTQLVRPALENVTYREPERIRRESGQYLRYRADEVRNVESLLGSGVSAENVSSFDAAMVVGPNGSVRRVAYQATIDREGRTFSLYVRVDVTQLGGVALTDPEWVSEAEAASQD